MQKRLKTCIIACLLASIIPFVYMTVGLSYSALQVNSSFFWISVPTILGSMLGLIGAILMFWQFILGSRYINSLFHKDLIWFNKLHKKVGMYGLSLVFMHPLLILLASGEKILYLFQFNFRTNVERDLTWGRIAFALFIIVWISSAILRKKLRFRPWLYIHYLTYPMMFLVLVHAKALGTYINMYPLLEVIWVGMTNTFLVFVVYRLLKWLGVGKVKATLIEKQKVGDDLYVYKFKTGNKTIVPNVGQFCYLQKNRFGESHPFSAMEVDTGEKTITFGIRSIGNFTGALSTLDVGDFVWLDGPYGVFTVEGHNTDAKVLIAGGIGITPFVEMIRKYGNNMTYLFYANSFINNAIRRDLFKTKLNENYYDVVAKEQITDRNIINGTLQSKDIKRILPQEIINTAKFFICGSPGFYTNYKTMLLSLGIASSKIFYEEFGL